MCVRSGCEIANKYKWIKNWISSKSLLTVHRKIPKAQIGRRVSQAM